MDRLLQESDLTLPGYIEEALKEESIASYNMGLFGGNDLDFIHEYCKEALALCDRNKATCLNGNFNLLFEQILFAYKTKQEKLPVSTIFPGVFNDNGYTANDFCQLEEYPQRSYFHLLGGHKRNRDITESLEEVLFINYPESYRAVTALFPYLHPRSFGEGTVCIPLMTADEPIKSYIEFLNEAERSGSVLSMKDLTEVESKRIEGRYLSRHDDKMSEELAVRINPYLKFHDKKGVCPV